MTACDILEILQILCRNENTVIFVEQEPASEWDFSVLPNCEKPKRGYFTYWSANTIWTLNAAIDDRWQKTPRNL